MPYCFLALGIALVGGSLALLWRQVGFLRRAKEVAGTVLRVRRMNSLEQDDGGPAMHLEIRYVDEQGETRTHIDDNSLLAYVSGDRVMMKSLLNIATCTVCAGGRQSTGLFVDGLTAHRIVLGFGLFLSPQEVA